MHGWKELNRAIDSWVGQHLGRHDSEEYANYRSRFVYWYMLKTGEMLRPHGDGRQEFGMSKSGGCTRAASLDKLGFEATPFGPGTLMTFEIGHDFEPRAFALLEAIGCMIIDTQAEVVIDGLMRSWSDAIVKMPIHLGGETVRFSIKSIGYKYSKFDFRSKKATRMGFAELPFEGVLQAQPSWWAQAQFEMYGDPQNLPFAVLALAKDTNKSMERDQYMLEAGSVFAYAERIEANPLWVEKIGLKVWREVASDTKAGSIAKPYVLNGYSGTYVELESASNDDKINRDKTGKFNHCAYCDMFESCSVASRGVLERRMTQREQIQVRKTNNGTTTNVSTN